MVTGWPSLAGFGCAALAVRHHVQRVPQWLLLAVGIAALGAGVAVLLTSDQADCRDRLAQADVVDPADVSRGRERRSA